MEPGGVVGTAPGASTPALPENAKVPGMPRRSPWRHERESQMDDMSNRPPVLHLNPSDPLVIATRDLDPGEAVGLAGLAVLEPIVRGHKMAVNPIKAGEPVRKLGQIIGTATRDIRPGQHVHVHNLEFRPSAADHSIGIRRSN